MNPTKMEMGCDPMAVQLTSGGPRLNSLTLWQTCIGLYAADPMTEPACMSYTWWFPAGYCFGKTKCCNTVGKTNCCNTAARGSLDS